MTSFFNLVCSFRGKNSPLFPKIVNQSCRYLTSKKTFYDSQSGQHITLPGSSGNRTHDSTLVQNRFSQFLKKEDKIEILKVMEKIKFSKPSTIEINMELLTNQTIIESLSENNNDPIFMVNISTVNDLEKVSKYRKFCKGITINRKQNKVVNEIIDENNIKNLIRHGKNNNLLVQTNIHCIKPTTINTTINAIKNDQNNVDNENYNFHEILPVITDLADYGADIIMLNLPNFDANIEDDLQLLIEDSFNLDIQGDPMMERLGVFGSPEISKIALNCGITHFTCIAEGCELFLKDNSGVNDLGNDYVTNSELANIIAEKQ